MDVFKLTLVRHGETPENRLKIIQGHRDTVLSQKGARQAELLGLRLENEMFTHVYSSDLTRAQQTCEIIMKQNRKSKVHIKTDVRLRERKLGVLEGQPMSSSKGLLRSDSKKQMSLGMETKQQLRQHAKSFFKELCSCLLQFQPRTPRPHRSTGEDRALSSDESKGACSMSFTSAIHSLPSTSSAASTDIFSETSRLSLRGESNVLSTETLELRNSFGNNNSAVSNNTETCDSNDTTLPFDVPTSVRICADVGGTVAESGDYRDIADANDGVNNAGNREDNVVSRDVADNSNNVCKISGNESAEAAACPSVISVMDDDSIISVMDGNSVISVMDDDSIISVIDDNSVISVIDDNSRPGDDSTADDASEVNTECVDAESNSQMYDIFASVLIVSHGGLLMELLAYFVKELKCKLSDSQKARFRLIPNAGVSKFVVQVGDGTKAFPKVVCLSVFETDHLMGGNEDVAPMVSAADLI